MKEKPNTPLHEILITVTSLAVHSLDSAIQKKFVNLALVIRNRRKRSLNLGNEIQPCYILGEIDEIIGDWWTCKYLPSSFDLLPNLDANTTL